MNTPLPEAFRRLIHAVRQDLAADLEPILAKVLKGEISPEKMADLTDRAAILMADLVHKAKQLEALQADIEALKKGGETSKTLNSDPDLILRNSLEG